MIGINIDSKFTQKAFAEKLQLKFPLVADPNREVSQQLGTLLPEVGGVKSANYRGVLIIDPAMTLRWQFGESAALQPDVAQVLAEVQKTVGA